MKKNKLRIALFLGFGIALIACKKTEEEMPVAVTIVIEEPTSGDTVIYNDEVHFEGTVSATGEMHGYTLSFINATADTVLFSQVYDVHASAYNFHEHWMNHFTDTTIVTAKIDVVKDHDGNHEVKQVNVVCLPQ